MDFYKIISFKITYLFLIVLLFNSSYSQNIFSLCGDKKIYPYYNPELKNKKEFNEIKEYFFANFSTSKYKKIKQNSGVVIIQFQVNCEGKSGNFLITTCNLDYIENKVNTKITEQLKKLTSELKDWIPAKNENGELVNSHKFYAFKIINGVLIEIMPK